MVTTQAPRRDDAGREAHRRFASGPVVGLLATFSLMALAIVVPAVTGWDVHISFPPLFASWEPRVGPGTVVAIPLAVLGLGYADRLARTLSWPALLLSCWAAALAWLSALLMVDVHNPAQSYSDVRDLLDTARATTDVSQTLHEFVTRIWSGPNPWPTHVAGHPAGALLFFVLLVRLGLGSSIGVGVVITLMASTIPLAALTSLRELGAERQARLAAPFLVFTPAVIWEAVSFDAVIACLAAWGLAVLAYATARRSLGRGFVAGLALGTCLELSYGVPLLGPVAIAIAMAAKTWRPFSAAAVGAGTVLLTFAGLGFALWDAYPQVRGRYLDGVGGGLRPAGYWLWADLAALAFSAGPALGVAVGQWWVQVRRHTTSHAPERRVVMGIGGAALLGIGLADLSLMSKAEVERIWLPFVPWLLVLSALLPPRWRRPALAIQLVTALLVQHLLVTAW